ncbi:MAG: hypothetical protein IIU63_02205 [Clostridia bacterium]|nr:hypothetical protein [Clostridia bacterium]
MKRFLSVLLASLMVLTMAVVLVVPTSAALEGDWVTSRSGADYEDEGNFCPAPGYHYDPAIGFVMDPPVYAPDNTPFVQAHTRNALDLKADNDGQGNSVSLKFTVLEYAYDGPEGGKDQWIALTLNSQPRSTPGNVNYGEGICILIRRGVNGSSLGEGRAQFETFYVDKTGYDSAPKNFGLITGNGFGLVQGDVPMNENGQEEYTFTVKYTDGGYVLSINEVSFGPDPYLNTLLDTACAEGAYVGLLAQTGEANTQISLAITEWQGDLPVGDDSATPEEDLRSKAPIADSATVEANMPAVLWDSTLRDFRKIDPAGATFAINDDGSVKLNIQTQSPYINFGIKSEVSYEAKDFPYIAVLTRNCWANSGNVFYCAGPNLSASDAYSENWDIEDTVYGEWTLGLIDFSDYNEDGWVGRINSIRVGFDFSAEDVADEQYNNFDVAFIGAFRSPEEAKAYTQAWLTAKGYAAEEVTTEKPTEAPAGTDAETEPATGNSCKALVAAPVVALVAILGVAFVAKKKD